MSSALASAVAEPSARIPRQISCIIGNEGCERFSFYGMRNILTVFLVSSLLVHLPEGDRAGAAKDVFHTFVIGNLWVLVVNAGVKNATVTRFIASTGFGVTAFQMFFFAAFAFAAALAFGLVARSYRTVDYYRKA